MRKALLLHDAFERRGISVRTNRFFYKKNLLKRLAECSSKHNRGVSEVFFEAARVSLGTRSKGSGEGCIVM